MELKPFFALSVFYSGAINKASKKSIDFLERGKTYAV